MFLSFRHVSDPSVSRRDEGETLRKCEDKGGKCHPKTERNEGSNRRTSQGMENETDDDDDNVTKEGASTSELHLNRFLCLIFLNDARAGN